MTTFACRAVLFDCDGVLVDSDASVLSAWQRWAADQSLDPGQVTSIVHGRRSADTVALLVDEAGRDEALRRINRYEIEDAADVGHIPGAPELTRSMPPGSWAVVTSGTGPLARARLAAAGIALPDVLITADDVEHGKPHPEGYAAAARRLGVDAAHAVVIEDALAGIRAARAAGVGAVIGVGDRELGEEADVVVTDLRRLSWTGTGLRVEER